MTRRQALNTYLRENVGRSYSLGIWDCAIFAFGAVEAQTGVDHLAEYHGRYSDYDTAVALMKTTDRVATLRTLVTKKLGDPIPVAFARTGDVVGVAASVGILYGDHAIMLAEHSGYERAPRHLLDRAWSIRT